MAQHEEVSGWTGWVAFASILLMFDGAMQFLYGIAALANRNWYVSTDTASYFVSLSTWGWTYIILGVLLFTSGMMLLRGSLFGRMMGILFVTLGIVANLAFLPITPVWSILALIAYSLSGYAILAHGGEMKELANTRA